MAFDGATAAIDMGVGMSGSQTLTLVCFPHAGGSPARYRRWRDQLPDDVELLLPLLPGRERRLFETPYSDVASVSRHVIDELGATLADRDHLAFAGLSYGALVAYDLAVRMQATGKQIRGLFAASQRSPRLLPPQADWHLMDDDALLAELHTYDGMASLQRDLGEEEFRELFLPTLRADLRASETYLKPAGHARLRCPVFVYHGTDDVSVPPAFAWAWKAESDDFSWRSIESDHFLTGPDGADLWFDALIKDLMLCRQLV